LLHLVVEAAVHPDLPALQPDIFSWVVDGTIPVKATEIASVFPIDRVPRPERDHGFKKVRPILPAEISEIQEAPALPL
jgi:hypothetical protein